MASRKFNSPSRTAEKAEMRKSLLAFCCLVTCPSLIAQQVAAPSTVPPSPSATELAVQPPAGPPPPHTLLDGTPVTLRISQTISSADAKVGQEVPFEVMEDLQVDGVTVLPKGSTAIGTVTEAEPKRRMGRGGKLNININYARLVDQEKVALRAAKDTNGGGHVGAMTGAIVATSIVFFPAAPLFLLMHGKDISIPQGTEITSFVDGDMHLNMVKFSVAPTTGAAPAAAEASIVVGSTPPGADIAVDGAFVGNTPSTLSIALGAHEVTVSKKGYSDWDRKLNVTGGNIHLDADLGPASAAPTPAPVSR